MRLLTRLNETHRVNEKRTVPGRSFGAIAVKDHVAIEISALAVPSKEAVIITARFSWNLTSGTCPAWGATAILEILLSDQGRKVLASDIFLVGDIPTLA